MKRYLSFLVMALCLIGCSSIDGEMYTVSYPDAKNFNQTLSEDEKQEIKALYPEEIVEALYHLDLDPDFSGGEVFVVSKSNDNQHMYFRVLTYHKKEWNLLFEKTAEFDEVLPYQIGGFFPNSMDETNFVLIEKRNEQNIFTYFVIGKLSERDNIEILVDNEFTYNLIPYFDAITYEPNSIVLTTALEPMKETRIVFDEEEIRFY